MPRERSRAALRFILRRTVEIDRAPRHNHVMHPKEPPRINLAQLPTPVAELKNLGREMSVPRILCKRDDLTGLEVSGNKVRKLEYLLADAQAQGADTLVTNGGFQSNHCRATAAIGARLGMKVRLILRAPADGSEPSNEGNLFFDRLLGAHITMHPVSEYSTNRKAIIDQAMADERAAGRKPYFFPVGASVPLGCWGYIRCFRELLDQLGAETKIDVFATVSSSGTYAGLVLGKALFRAANWRVVGIPVSDSIEFFQKDLRELIHATNDKFSLGLSESDTSIELLDDFIGEGYAIPYPAAIETVKRVARSEGLILDPTYTSKAMYGFLETIRTGGVRKGATPLFVHTGGAFGLMARRDLFS
jgi:D-cysteine desulfhydrase